MECNKEEAVRAKELAEKKLAEMDIHGAKRFAVRAQNLYPMLDGLPQLLATLDVYVSSEKRVNGEVDWYGVLGLQPLADDDAIRKHYRKLALTIHPDKNKLVGAEGAFKTVSEAWSVLSDKDKKMSYDQKLNCSGAGAADASCQKSSPVPASQNGFHTSPNSNTSNAPDRQSASHPCSASPQPVKTDSFWTTCSSCKVQFEYLRTYLNRNLCCVKCHKPFRAVETPPPSRNGKNGAIPFHPNMQQKNTSRAKKTKASRFSRFNSSFRVPTSAAFTESSSNIGVGAPSSFSAQSAGGSQPEFEQLNRECKEAQTASLRDDGLEMKSPAGLENRSSAAGFSDAVKLRRPKKKRCTNDRGLRGYEGNMTDQMAMGNNFGVPRAQNGSSETIRADHCRNSRYSRTKELSHLGMQNLLMMKAKTDILRHLKDCKPASRSNASHESNTVEKEISEKQQGNGAATVNPGNGNPHKKPAEVKDLKTSTHTERLSSAAADSDPIVEEADLMSMSVPDPDFHDFDNDRTEVSFGDNEVWAAYDNDDGMPRYYAMVQTVMTLTPFKMRISWLNSKSNHELGQMNWIGSGFYKTCGDFWIGKYAVNKSLNSFSHQVKWSKGRKGAIQIYPQKGDVWALYRNWSPDWNALTPDEVIHKYGMVEVLEDVNEQSGVVVVVPLVKVAGFKTVFRQHPDPSKTMTIPREEMFRLSHQVPSHVLTGREGPNAPAGCLELDPAATPLELLTVLTEAQVKEMEVTSNMERPVKKAVEENDMKKPDVIVYKRRRQVERGNSRATTEKFCSGSSTGWNKVFI